MNTTVITMLSMLFMLSACSQQVINLQLQSSARINVDAQQRPLAVAIVIYQLKSKSSFTSASFWQLWRHDKVVLGDQLLSRQSYMLRPQAQYHLSVLRQHGANYLAAIAIFRQPARSQWRAIIPLPQRQWFNISLNLTVNHNRIMLS